MSCKIKSCKTDDRLDVIKSTRVAIESLREAYTDKRLQNSGSVVQATILSHNGGYHDEPYLGKIKWTNILPAYERYRKKTKKNMAFIFMVIIYVQ